MRLFNKPKGTTTVNIAEITYMIVEELRCIVTELVSIRRLLHLQNKKNKEVKK